jgi:flagella basal body P-ring formation protein FlgA
MSPPSSCHIFCLRIAALFFLLGLSLPVHAQQSTLAEALDQYLRTQTQGLPGKVHYRIGQLDSRTQLSPCSAFEPFLPAGSRLWGKATVGVRCLGPSNWTVYVPVQVTVTGTYLVTTRPMAAGQVIGAGDIVPRDGDLGTLPAGILTDPAQAIGKTIKNGISAGQPLRSDFVIAPWAVQQGQSVRLLSKGAGFSVSGEGKALNNAVDGQITQVRTGSGQTVSGIARPGGIVEVSY